MSINKDLFYNKSSVAEIIKEEMGTMYLLSDAATYTSGCDMIIDGCFTNV